MKLSSKRARLFLIGAISVMVLGGISCRSPLKSTSDELLKQGSVDMVSLCSPTLLAGLARSQNAISMDEHDVIERLAATEGVTCSYLLISTARCAGSATPARSPRRFEQFVKEVTLPTNAIEQATLAKTPAGSDIPGLPLYDIAIPLAIEGEVMGVLDLQMAARFPLGDWAAGIARQKAALAAAANVAPAKNAVARSLPQRRREGKKAPACSIIFPASSTTTKGTSRRRATSGRTALQLDPANPDAKAGLERINNLYDSPQ